MDGVAARLLKQWIFVQISVGQDQRLAFHQGLREQLAASGEYPANFLRFLERFMDALLEGDWQPGTYFPGGWYRQLVARGEDPMEADITPLALERFYQEEVRVDAQGNWFLGTQPIQGRVADYFLRHLEFDEEVACYRIRYRLQPGFEMRYLHHVSPPLRVVNTQAREGEIMLYLNDGRELSLQPETLRLNRKEHLFCAVGEQGLPAMFEENPRWQVLQMIEEQSSGWVLSLGKKKILLALEAGLDFPGGVGTAMNETGKNT